MVQPVFIDLAPALRQQIDARSEDERDITRALSRPVSAAAGGGLPAILRGRTVQNAHGERGLALSRRPMFAMGADAAPQSSGVTIRVYRDGPGDYRALAVVPWHYRDEQGVRRPCKFAIEVKVDRVEDEGAVAGADGDVASSITSSVVHPVLDRIAAVLSHPLAALAASASVLTPGVGPAYLVGYAIGQSLVDYAERKTR